jgi:hypothetical protein
MAGGIPYYWSARTRYRKRPGFPRSRPFGNNPASAKSQAVTPNEPFNERPLQRVQVATRHSTSRRVSAQNPTKTKAAQNFQMAGEIHFQMRPKIRARTKPFQ